MQNSVINRLYQRRVQLNNELSTSSHLLPVNEMVGVLSDNATPRDRRNPKRHAYIHSLMKHMEGSDSLIYTDRFNPENSYTRLEEGYLPLSSNENYSVSNGWPQPSSDLDSYNDALSRLYSMLTGGVNLSVDLAEHGQTKEMLSLYGKAITRTKEFQKDFARSYDLIESRKSKSYRSPWKVKLPGMRAAQLLSRGSKILADKWLEFQYGWSPLLSTVGETAFKLTQKTVPSKLHAIASAKQEKTWSEESNSGIPGAVVKAHCYQSDRSRFLVAYLPPNYLQEVWESFQFNPAGIAWELVPFSFVVDWFYDLGGYMADYENALKFNTRFEGGFYTHTTLYECKSSVNYHETTSAFGGMLTNERLVSKQSSLRRTSLNRVLLLSAPLPRPPRFDVRLGSGRLLNAAALLRQLI